MGTCESFFQLNREKSKYKNSKDYNNEANLKNKGPNFYCAPIDSSVNNDNIYVKDISMSQTTMTMDMSQYNDYKRPQIYQYINKYQKNGLQNSVVKASLVELGQNNNSLVYSNIKNSKVNQTNSLYTSKCDDTGYESSYDGYEMIIDGKMDEELVQKSTDKNTINNYNEFIKKKDNNNNNNKNPKIMDYYKKNLNNDNNNKNNNNNKNLDVILKESNKEGDDLSRIPSPSDIQKLKINKNINNNKNSKNNNINSKNNNLNMKNNMINYIQSMGKY